MYSLLLLLLLKGRGRVGGVLLLQTVLLGLDEQLETWLTFPVGGLSRRSWPTARVTGNWTEIYRQSLGELIGGHRGK
jgi:hypothetical protein